MQVNLVISEVSSNLQQSSGFMGLSLWISSGCVMISLLYSPAVTEAPTGAPGGAEDRGLAVPLAVRAGLDDPKSPFQRRYCHSSGNPGDGSAASFRPCWVGLGGAGTSLQLDLMSFSHESLPLLSLGLG